MFIRSQQIISPSEKWTNKEEDKFVHPIAIHFGSLHIYIWFPAPLVGYL